MGVGFGVAGFVAVVVGEAVGEDEEEPIGGGPGCEEFAGVAGRNEDGYIVPASAADELAVVAKLFA